MDDFEYSVEICDRDWECFFAECEECNLLPPSLAGVDDSGMSDIDDTGSILAQRTHRLNSTQGFSENPRPIDSNPECEGSPVEYRLTEHCTGGLDSILSGSEEDLHLQSVNIFFEKLKNLTGAESSQEKSQDRIENKVTQQEAQCGDGQPASRNHSPKNFPKSNLVPARSETALGKERGKPVETGRDLKTKEQIKTESNISTELAALGKSDVKSWTTAEIELFIREESSIETRVNELTQGNEPHDSTNDVVYSETTPQPFKLETCKNLDEQEGLLTLLSKNCVMREDPIPSQESSPSSSLRRKRRKKRRFSMEVGESGQACERQVLIKQSDSEEDQHTLRQGAVPCFSEESAHLSKLQKSLACISTPCSVTSILPVDISANEIDNELSHHVPPCDGQHLPNPVPELRRWTASGSAENNVSNHKLVSDDNATCSVSSCANGATHLQPCSKLQLRNSTGLIGNGNQNHITKACDQQQFEKTNISVNSHEDREYRKYTTAEVKAVNPLPSTDSCASPVEVSQRDKQSAAKSVLAAEAGNSGRDESALCQNEAELQQQLESDCHNSYPCSHTQENVHCPPPTVTAIKSHTDAKSSTLKTSDEAIPPPPTSDCCNRSSLLPTNSTCGDQESPTDHPVAVKTSYMALEKNTTQGKDSLEGSEKLVLTSNSQTETKLSSCEDLDGSPSDITGVSSFCTLDTDSVMSVSNENLTDMSASFCSSASEHESGSQGERKAPSLAKHGEGDLSPGPKSQPECKFDTSGEAGEAITASEALEEHEQLGNSVFAMSSFWREMEKLTINDILGLRNISNVSHTSSLPPVQESEETEPFTVSDQGNLAQNNGSAQNKQATAKTSGTDSLPSRSVTWESEPVPASHGRIIYPMNPLLTSATDTPEPVLSERAQKCLKKISKTISVHNLQALESASFSHPQKGETFHTLSETEPVEFENLTGESPHKLNTGEKSAPSVTDSYSISLTNIFQYLFGGKQSVPHHSATNDVSALYIGGNTVPETYDDFFSEFDTENFFYPLITAEEKNQDQTVPIFSCSRSAGRNLQFPEAYEYFFASSSSDDSSLDSDGEDDSPPVRVVSRFSQKANSTVAETDIYEDLFADSDLMGKLFCLKSLSFRKIKFTTSADRNQRSNSGSLVPVRKSCTSTLMAEPHISALRNPDVLFADPLLCHWEERISRQLALQPFRHEDLQAAVSNPGLDAPLLPLKQSDMCLVCIAFASWVLKTANPQVGDAWKAVLLANVSALSAIRYLRKYVKTEATASQMTRHQAALTYP
ncbi:unnamed protein product [Menidia menidia]|uniref:(Atlantic silverside) hypothetical protein n=1 Tax=Menidia menidia TaxID=238744 RepID=A0A8S4BZH1_9TELE|nr:unnamed protein product [Menidia menidia]